MENQTNSQDLQKFTADLTQQVIQEKAVDFAKAATSGHNYEQFITDLGLIFTNAIVDFIVARGMSPDDLVNSNRQRLDTLDEWLKERLAALPNNE